MTLPLNKFAHPFPNITGVADFNRRVQYREIFLLLLEFDVAMSPKTALDFANTVRKNACSWSNLVTAR